MRGHAWKAAPAQGTAPHRTTLGGSASRCGEIPALQSRAEVCWGPSISPEPLCPNPGADRSCVCKDVAKLSCPDSNLLSPGSDVCAVWGVMCIILQRKTLPKGAVPCKTHPKPPCKLCSTVSTNGTGLGRCTWNVLLQQVAVETLPHMSASAENLCWRNSRNAG